MQNLSHPPAASGLPRHKDLISALRHHCAETGDSQMFSMAQDGLNVDVTLTAKELYDKSAAVAALLALRSAPGDRVMLFYPQGLDFITGFLGCLLAGCIAVPVYPPRRSQNPAKVIGIARDCGANLALSPAELSGDLQARFTAADPTQPLTFVDSDSATPATAPDRFAPRVQPIALLQYTSGSTGAPKGVVITHENLVANAHAIETAMQCDASSVLVSWLPNFHDMGLITSVVLPIYTGFCAHLMPPGIFVRSPEVWLKRISQVRASHAGCPNFGYDLCCDKVDADTAAALDLSSWRIALNGAEPVLASTLTHFAKHFAAAGFDPVAFRPCFGMAESTLMVTGKASSQTPRFLSVDENALAQHRIVESTEGGKSKTLVGCGLPPEDVEIVIADPQSHQNLESGQVGEIWLRGPSLGQGYWNKAELSAAAFGARLADRPDKGPYFRTGDYGALLGGELFVTGRMKETLIFRGRTFYPLDIEIEATAAHPALVAGQAAAFATADEGATGLIILAELRRDQMRKVDPGLVCAKIRGALVTAFDLDPVEIALLPPLSLPKTSSGKLQRGLASQLYAAGELRVIGSVIRDTAPSADVPQEIATAPRSAADIMDWATAWIAREKGLPLPQIRHDAPFAELGLESLTAVRMTQELSRFLGVAPLNAATLAWRCPTIAALGQELAQTEDHVQDQVQTSPPRDAGLGEMSEQDLARLLADELAK